jgi:AraC-like DNA-binding protein/quercetin dioxygenase-like cupin family protein
MSHGWMNMHTAPMNQSLVELLRRFPVQVFCNEARQKTSWHSQVGLELNLTCEGRGIIQVNEREFCVEPGCLLIIPHLASHQLRAHTPVPYVRSVLCLVAEPSAGNSELAGLLKLPVWSKPQCLSLGVGQFAVWNGLLERIASESQFKTHLWKEATSALVGQALILVARLAELQKLSKRPEAPLGSRVREIAGFVRRHLPEDLGAKRIAAIFRISREHLSREFRREYGVTFHNYVVAERIVAARQELNRYPSRTLLEVALNCGFQSHSHFSRIFRRSVGISPKEFRTLDGSGRERDHNWTSSQSRPDQRISGDEVSIGHGKISIPRHRLRHSSSEPLEKGMA